jgi:hypothetical protein
VRPLLRIDRRQNEIAWIAQTAIEFPPMQRGKLQISRVKVTDREGDAARAEISFNCVAYHQPRSILWRRFSSSIMNAISTKLTCQRVQRMSADEA